MENSSCLRVVIMAIIELMRHHPEEVIEHLLSQPLPLDPGTMLCWKEISKTDSLGYRVSSITRISLNNDANKHANVHKLIQSNNLFQALELLLIKLENNNLFAEITSPDYGRSNTAYLPSLAIIVGLKHLLESPSVENLISNQLPELLSVLLKYLAGWLHVDAPSSMIHTKYGYVPNRAMQKINPHAEVYSVLVHVLTVIQPNAASNLPEESVRINMFLKFAVCFTASHTNFCV